MNKYIITIMLAVIFAGTPSISSMAGWESVSERWQYFADGKLITDGWITDNQENYYVDSKGYMKTEWMQHSGAWYFLNTIHDGTYGKALKGWQWIDGCCYFFQNDGKMLANTVTPDGFIVSESGVWSIEGKTQYIKNKGITTLKPDMGAIHLVNGSGGGGGGSSGTSSGIPQDAMYTYTIQYMDIRTNAVLRVIAGQGRKNDIISMEHQTLDGYEICSDQKEEFTLKSNHQVIRLYYEKQQISSPSDAVKVSWEVHFVEKGSVTNKVFNSQRGMSLEGTELIIDFPEKILKNGYHYRALAESPYHVFLFGTGTQKIYIEYGKSGLSEDSDSDTSELERLDRWLELSRTADESLTGIVSMNGQLLTSTVAESNARLKNLASMTEDTKRYEVYLIAKNHLPSSFVLGQMSNIGSISEQIMDHFLIGEDEYTVLKVGFKAFFEEESCSHNFTITNDTEAKCLANGSETAACKKCAYEVSVVIPAAGHQDAAGDGICDTCCEMIAGNEMPEAVHYEEGDMQARRIGEKVYLFRCIDEDYEDSLNNKQRTALFLCEQVIRSDIDSTLENLKTMTYGSNNNYKSSTIRSWLKANAVDSLFAGHTSYTGVTLAYIGATQKDSYEQFDDTSLAARSKPFQLLEDNIFLLSVEEAVKYREYLWKFNDFAENNPESQYSAYSKGYWLRTPQYLEKNGQFAYGAGAYMVDLMDGNIHAAEVSNRSIGIRPAITVVQY